MRISARIVKYAGIALMTALSAAPALAQSGQPGLYAFHTGQSGGCPGLDWHVTLEPDRTLVGFVAWDRMTHMARLSGSIDQQGAFKGEAKEVGGSGKTATIAGSASGNYITISIDGTGTPCDKQVLYFPRTGGGTGGGGG